MCNKTQEGILCIHGGGQCAGSSDNILNFCRTLRDYGYIGNIGFCKYSFAGITDKGNYFKYPEESACLNIPNFLGTSRVEIPYESEEYIKKVVETMELLGYNSLAVFGGDGSSNLVPLLAKQLEKYNKHVVFCGSHTGDGFLCGQDQVGVGPEAAAVNHYKYASLLVYNDWNTKVSIEEDIFYVSIVYLQGRRKADSVYRLLKEMDVKKYKFYGSDKISLFAILPGTKLENVNLLKVQDTYKNSRVCIIMSEGAQFEPSELKDKLSSNGIKSRLHYLGYVLQAGENQIISPESIEATQKVAMQIAKYGIKKSACMAIIGGKLYVKPADYFSLRNPSRDPDFEEENLTAEQYRFLKDHKL